MDRQVIITSSAEETEAFGEKLAGELGACRIIAMYGDLGSGKTALVRGLARGLGCTDAVSSPTYTIVNEYRGPKKLCHFDMYRLAGPDSLYEIGWEDYLSSGCICAVEWSENIEDALPPGTLKIIFEKPDDNTRTITVEEKC